MSTEGYRQTYLQGKSVLICKSAERYRFICLYPLTGLCLSESCRSIYCWVCETTVFQSCAWPNYLNFRDGEHAVQQYIVVWNTILVNACMHCCHMTAFNTPVPCRQLCWSAEPTRVYSGCYSYSKQRTALLACFASIRSASIIEASSWRRTWSMHDSSQYTCTW